MNCLRLDHFLKVAMFLGILVFLNGCEKDSVSKEFMSFYFPIYELQEGRVYEYRPVNNDTLPVDYWYYSSHIVDKQLHFTGNYYNDRFQVQQFFREIQESDGMKLSDFILYDALENGKQKQIKVEILERETFPSNYIDSTKTFKMGVKWNIPSEQGTSISLLRERKYIGRSQHAFRGEKYECAIFKTLENIEHYVEDDGYLEPSFPGIEIYAKDLGLIYYKKQLSDEVVIEYELYTTYTMKEFEEKFKRSLEGQLE